MRDRDTLRLAVTAVRHGGGPRRTASLLRRHGSDPLSHVFRDLPSSARDDVEAEVEELISVDAGAVILGLDSYPGILAELRSAPPVLFYLGAPELMATPAIGMCGSRRASPEGLDAARACAREAAMLGLTVVSGYARGVDTEAHGCAVGAGGRTVIVLPEGILRFRGKDPMKPNDGTVTVISQFPPRQSWTTGGAMTRNGVIVGLCRTLVAVEPGQTGGTLNSALQALAAERQVLTLEIQEELPAGSKILYDKGAIPVRGIDELGAQLARADDGSTPSQLPLLDV